MNRSFATRPRVSQALISLPREVQALVSQPRISRSRPILSWWGLPLLLAAAAPLAPPLPPARAQESPASAASPSVPPADPRPFPALELGMHTSVIRQIAVDRAGRWAVTASDDKTARIWDLNSGRLERVLRVPVGQGYEGKLYGAAISPDGSLVALGGFTQPAGTDQAIYLFERASGRLLQRLGGLPSSADSLAFSADGRRLAAAISAASGIRVYEAGAGGRWDQVAADAAYGGEYSSVEFDASGRLLATSWDGDLRLYAAGQRGTLTPLIRRPAPGGKRPNSARFSPDGRRIAVAFEDSTAISILDGITLSSLGTPETRGIERGRYNYFIDVAWSVDGNRLFAGGTFFRNTRVPLVSWDGLLGRPKFINLMSTNSIMNLRTLDDHRLLYAT